ncbi:MAG: hypothetical protein LBQ38_02210 [Spirochaetaceae bacterium]|jgi:hypothetical protein|nr:hypothetical protein [Spirochaetaceae bacterium]
MNYWDEVKRIQIKLKTALCIPTNQATDIIGDITGKLGYIFTVNHIYHSVLRDNVLARLAEAKKRGEQPEMIAQLEDYYRNEKEYVVAEELEDAEIAECASELDQVVRQLETEVDEYIRVNMPEGGAHW